MQDGTRSQIFRSDVITASTWRKFLPPRQRQIGGDVGRKMRFTSDNFERQIVARSCATDLTPSHSTVIHHKRASRYVVLGEISLSPFTEYIFVEPGGCVQVPHPAVSVPRDGLGSLVCQLGYFVQFIRHRLPPLFTK